MQLSESKQASKRSYLYDKQVKEGLPFNLTRFEIKLQNTWFLNNELNIDSIVNTMNRYHIMYFQNTMIKDSKINAYDNYVNVTAREIKQLEFERYRLYVNPSIIKEFIRYVQTAYVSSYGGIAIPPLKISNVFL